MATEGRILIPADVSGGNPVRTLVQSTQANDEGAPASKDLPITALGDGTTPANIAGVSSFGALQTQGVQMAASSAGFAAAATGTAGPIDVSTAGNITFWAKNTVAATAWTGNPVLVFEQSDDGASWAALSVVRSDTGVAASTHTLPANAANKSYSFDAAMEGISQVRVRVTTGTTANGMTISWLAGSLPFSPILSRGDQAGSTATPTSVTAAAADTSLLAANASRRWASFYNESTAVLYLSLGSAAASTTSYMTQVPPGGTVILNDFTGPVRGIWAAANGSARITEVTP